MSQSKNFREGPVHILPFKFESAVYMISTIEPQRQMERSGLLIYWWHILSRLSYPLALISLEGRATKGSKIVYSFT